MVLAIGGVGVVVRNTSQSKGRRKSVINNTRTQLSESVGNFSANFSETSVDFSQFNNNYETAATGWRS